MKKVFEKVKADRRIIIGYSASMILLLITYIVTLVANNNLKQRTVMVDHTVNAIFNLELLLSTIKDAETGARGYALTRDISFLDPFVNSKEKADSLQKYLVVLMKDNLVQQDRLTQLKELTKERFEIFREAIDYYKNGSPDSTFKVTEAQYKSKQLMDRIRLH